MQKSLVIAAAAALLGALAGASGCVDNRASIQVQMICQPTSDCTFPEDGCELEYAGYPVYDRALGTGDVLRVFLQIANQLADNSDASSGRLNTNGAHVDEIETELAGVVSGTYTVGVNAFIETSSVSVLAVPIPVGDSSLVGAPTGELLARVRFRGYYDDGTRWETGAFPITALVCSGCLTAKCGTAPSTCPESGEGQRPLECGGTTTPTP
ncbi:MAG TPA: hypothetical protein VFL83_05790 [Anaeromyxobacter sp.]|nr:hypothetical protein [Anaeromyxobacter sp.]